MMFFFLSLTFVIIDAFLAMLVKGWLQGFDRGWRKYTVAHLRAQERERRLQELERWKLHELVELLPILIQGSLLLYCIGMFVLVFPLHPPSAILCSIFFISVVILCGYTTYVSVVNSHSPFSFPLSRFLARGLATLRTWHFPITLNTRRITSAIRFRDRPPLHPQAQQADADTPHETIQPLSSNQGVAKPTQAHEPDGVENRQMGPRSRSYIDPQMRVHVLERLVLTTTEAMENIPIFLELLDQPVKNPTLHPFSVDKWKELLHITFGLLKDQSTLSVSTTRTLARTMMICYNHKTADRQLCLTLQHHLGSQESLEQSPRMPLNLLFSSCLALCLGGSTLHDMGRAIAFLEPSDAADAELLWMVKTSHRIMQPEDPIDTNLQFFVAVLTYVSSTEQSSRSKVPLTAAVIYAMHTIRSALDAGGINSIDRLCILPGTLSASGSAPMTFCPIAGIDALSVWSEDCIRIVKELLQWHQGSNWHNDFQLSLIAALYIESTKQAHARSTFADILKYTNITETMFKYPDSYDRGKLAIYSYMALSREPLDQGLDPMTTLFNVIGNLITSHSTLQLPGLRILEIAVRHVQTTVPGSSDWLQRVPFGLIVIYTDKRYRRPLRDVDHWVLLHLDTLLAPHRYLLPEEVKKLEWSDTPVKVHIAKARLELYKSLENVDRDGFNGSMPDREPLRVFLWSKDYNVCTQAFGWCVELAPISQPGQPGDGMFIPETMGFEWVGHFVHVLCAVDYVDGIQSWEFLKSHLVPKWAMLPSSWCCGFASAFLFSVARPVDGQGISAHRFLAECITSTGRDERESYLPFLATMLELIKSDLAWSRLTSLENWLAQVPEILENHNVHIQLENVLSSRKQQLVEENLGLLAELPLADLWLDQ